MVEVSCKAFNVLASGTRVTYLESTSCPKSKPGWKLTFQSASFQSSFPILIPNRSVIDKIKSNMWPTDFLDPWNSHQIGLMWEARSGLVMNKQWPTKFQNYIYQITNYISKNTLRATGCMDKLIQTSLLKFHGVQKKHAWGFHSLTEAATERSLGLVGSAHQFFLGWACHVIYSFAFKLLLPLLLSAAY